MRKHCSNGVIFEEEVATIKASHSKEALAQLKIEITSRSLPQPPAVLCAVAPTDHAGFAPPR